MGALTVAALVLLGVLVGLLAGLLVAGVVSVTACDAEELVDELARLVPGRRRDQ